HCFRQDRGARSRACRCVVTIRRSMARKLCFVVALLALIVVMQQAARAQDAREILQAAVRAMGAANVKTIQYSGTGWNAAVGQSYSPQDDWPHFEVTRYTRTIDYDAKSSREELTRRQGNNPPRGGLFPCLRVSSSQIGRAHV